MAQNQRLVELFQYDPANPSGPYRIFPVGKYVRNGKEFQITDEACAEFVRNFDANVLDRQVVTNIEHMAEEGSVGWIGSLVHRAGDGLYAVIDWTERGLKLLAEQAFRYFSPEVLWNGYEAKDGTKHDYVMQGLAITNYPYFGNQTALFSEKAAPGAEAWMSDDTEHFMYDEPMMAMPMGDGHNLLGMLEQISFLLKQLERAEMPDDTLIERITGVKNALKKAVSHIVDNYADDAQAVDYAMKTEDGIEYDKSCYLVADTNNPGEWKLRIKEMVDGKKTITKAQMGRAAAALGKGFRGNKVELTPEQRKSAVARLKAEYKKMGVADDDMPKMMSDDSASARTNWFQRLVGRTVREPEALQDDAAVDAAGDALPEPMAGSGRLEDTMADKEVVTAPVTPTPEPTPAPVAPPPAPQVTVEQFAEVTKMVKDLQAALTVKAQEVERFRDQYVSEQTARRKQEFTDTAQTKFSALPGKADELATLLMWVFDNDTTEAKALYTQFTGILDASNALMAEKFQERGHTPPTPETDAFSTRVNQKMAELRQANPAMAEGVAYREALLSASEEDRAGAKRWMKSQGL